MLEQPRPPRKLWTVTTVALVVLLRLLAHLHGLAAPGENAHASNQFFRLEWFYKVIICPQLKSFQFLAKFVLAM